MRGELSPTDGLLGKWGMEADAFRIPFTYAACIVEQAIRGGWPFKTAGADRNFK